MSKVYGCVADISAEVGAIAKARKNTAQNFQFRGIDDILNRMSPLLAKHRCFLTPEILSFEQVDRPTKNGGVQTFSKLKIRYHFFADDGSSVTTEVVGEAQDTADKSAAKAQSVAFKIACVTLFCIPIEDAMPDPDADEVEPEGDSTLTKIIKDAVVKSKSLDGLQAVQDKYHERKEQGRLSDSQCAEIDLAIVDKIKALTGGAK